MAQNQLNYANALLTPTAGDKIKYDEEFLPWCIFIVLEVNGEEITVCPESKIATKVGKMTVKCSIMCFVNRPPPQPVVANTRVRNTVVVPPPQYPDDSHLHPFMRRTFVYCAPPDGELRVRKTVLPPPPPRPRLAPTTV